MTINNIKTIVSSINSNHFNKQVGNINGNWI